jgi:hypothetical protein
MAVLLACSLLAGAFAACARALPVVESPYAKVFRAAGWTVPDGSVFERVFTAVDNGQPYEVVTWIINDASGLQLLQNGALVTDPEVAYRVLHSYAWLGEDAPFGPRERADLHELGDTLHAAANRYQGLFGLAHSLEPATEAVGRLKAIPVYGVPTIMLKGFPLLQVNNAWDLICLIPVAAADLCILEPALVGIHDQGQELEELLKAASADLDAFIALVDARDSANPPDGLAVSIAGQQAFAGLRNLLAKIDEANAAVGAAQEMDRQAAQALRKRQWGRAVGLLMKWLRTVGVQVDDLTNSLVGALDDLDQKLAGFLAESEAFANEVDRQLTGLEAARQSTEDRTMELGQMWRARPSE